METCHISQICIHRLLRIELGNCQLTKRSLHVLICVNSGKTRHINSSFRIIGNDDLDMWWKEVLGLDIIEQPLVTCCALDLSAGLDSAHVLSSATLPDVVLAGTCWVLVRFVWYCSAPGERGKVEEWPCK